MNRKILILSFVIFIIAFFWQLFLTLGIDFYWEDFDVFHPYWEKSAEFKIFKERYLPKYIQPSRLTLTLGIGKEAIKQFFSPCRLFQIGFGAWNFSDRPYQFLTWDLLKVHFNNKVILYRMLRSVIFAANTCIVFLLINQISTLFAILGVLLYISNSEMWLSTLYISNLALFTQCGVIISILLFTKLIEKHSLRHKDAWLYYFLILLVSNYSVLTKGDGRYLAIIFFLTLVFFRRKELKYHIAPLIILFMMEFPILGYIKKWFISNSFSPVNLASHEITSSNLSSLFMAISNHKFPMNAMGHQLIAILIITILFHLIYLAINSVLTLFHKNISITAEKMQIISSLKEKVFLFLLWFICTLAMSARVRSFRYGNDPFYFELYDLSYFIAPFILFFCCYILLIKNCIKKFFNVIFLSVILCLMLMQLISNIKRLDEFRNRSEYHFCVWQNAKKYIEKNSDNALVLAFTKFSYRPFVFISSNNKVINDEQSRFSELNFIETKFKEEKYKDIFVLSMEEIKFIGNNNNVTLLRTEKIDGNCGDLNDCLKLAMSFHNKYYINLYHFKFKNLQIH